VNQKENRKKKERQTATAYAKWLGDFMSKHDIRPIMLARVSGFHSNVILNWRRGHCLPNGYSFVVIATTLSRLTGIERSILFEEMAESLLRS
jgi:hypothetical protein